MVNMEKKSFLVTNIKVISLLFLITLISISCSWDLPNAPTEQILPAITANAGEDQIVDLGQFVTLTGSGNGGDPNSFAYNWTLLSGIEVETSTPEAQETSFFAPSNATSLSFLLTVSDGNVSATDTVVITITGQSITKSLVAYWKFNDNTGTTVLDHSDNENPINAIIAEASWVSGRAGSALAFDGLNDYARVLYNTSYRPTETITVQTWVNFSDLSSPRTLVSCAETGGWSLRYESGFMTFQVFILGVGFVIPSYNNISVNTWYHVAGTYDGSAVNLYVDGSLQDSIAITGLIHYELENFLIIGGEADSGVGPKDGDHFHVGKLSEMQIYNYARSADEIALDAL